MFSARKKRLDRESTYLHLFKLKEGSFGWSVNIKGMFSLIFCMYVITFSQQLPFRLAENKSRQPPKHRYPYYLIRRLQKVFTSHSDLYRWHEIRYRNLFYRDKIYFEH
ncbi:hypothetical protein DF947_00360 [Pedobacter paludis]|uniref:Uncharacterized protein n=1 Tax=Pedobacter paludis TaxID=2203212 RepID=A0A317F6H6_9SPHI|nr:hypothetical protein DF947_00360 [Pedobacter paludis]